MAGSKLPEDSFRHKGMRKQLAKKLAEKGIKDTRVLQAIESVPRHYFFDTAFIDHAYEDKAFPIGEGQTISQPYTVAIQTELLEIKKGDKVLEIGTGSGYQSCVLLELGVRLYSLEYIKNLHDSAKAMLDRMGYKANLFCGDGSKGFPSYAPFDKIIVTAGAPAVPETLVAQLNPGGILVIPVGDHDTQQMLRIRKGLDGTITKENKGAFRFVPLTGEQGWKK